MYDFPYFFLAGRPRLLPAGDGGRGPPGDRARAARRNPTPVRRTDGAQLRHRARQAGRPQGVRRQGRRRCIYLYIPIRISLCIYLNCGIALDKLGVLKEFDVKIRESTVINLYLYLRIFLSIYLCRVNQKFDVKVRVSLSRSRSRSLSLFKYLSIYLYVHTRTHV